MKKEDWVIVGIWCVIVFITFTIGLSVGEKNEREKWEPIITAYENKLDRMVEVTVGLLKHHKLDTLEISTITETSTGTTTKTKDK